MLNIFQSSLGLALGAVRALEALVGKRACVNPIDVGGSAYFGIMSWIVRVNSLAPITMMVQDFTGPFAPLRTCSI